MKSAISIILTCVLAVVSIGVTAVGLIGARQNHENTLCVGLDAKVCDWPQIQFIDSKGVKAVMDRDFGGYVNKPLSSIDTDVLEKVLLEQGYIGKCIAWTTPDGILHVEVCQRTPVLKLSQSDGIWYADDEGKCFKVKQDWCAGLPEIAGQGKIEDKKWIEGASRIGHWLQDNERWKAEIERINSDEKGDLDIKLAGRSENFIFGQPEDVEVKFRRIGEYLEKIAPRGIEYTSVSVKYKGQIICK